MKARVILFRQSGKYYCEEEWRIPYGAIGPYDMERSLDFRRIDGGPVLVDSQEPWGYPYLFPGVEITKEFDCINCGHPKEEHEVFESNKFLRTRETCWAEISSEPSKILIGAPEIIRCNCRRYSPKKDSK